MNISDVVYELDKIQTEHGDLPVYVWADHGQTCYTAYTVSVGYVDSDGESIHDDDLDDYAEEDLTKAVVIDG